MAWQTIGHEPARRALEQSVLSGRQVHSYLFTGPANVGKTALALDFAQALLCSGEPKPCGRCEDCRLFLTRCHPDMQEIEAEREAEPDFHDLWTPGSEARPPRALRIAPVRELIRVMALWPTRAAYRVATLDGSMVMDTAASALLSLFEEPAPHSILLLRASAIEAVPAPIVSRCRLVRLGSVPQAKIAGWLQTVHAVPAAEAAAYASLATGRPGLAKRLSGMPGGLAALDTCARQWLDLTAADTLSCLARAAAWGKGYPIARAALDLAGLLWHHLLQRAAAQAIPTPSPYPTGLTALDGPAAQDLIARGPKMLGQQLAILARASRLLDANVQPRLTMEWVVLELGSARSAPVTG